MAERYNHERTRRPLGSQPVFHDSATVDALGAMVLSLLGEVMVLRDRLDANERLSAARGGHGPADVDSYRPDPAACADRTRYREASYDRVLGSARDRLMPDALRQEQRAYETVLNDVTQQ